MQKLLLTYTFLCIIILLPNLAVAQLETLADKVLSIQIKEEITSEEQEEIQAFQSFLKFLRAQEKKEKSLNGRGQFGFSGSENEQNNLFIVRGGISIDKGNYPYELDFNSTIETIFSNGNFQENVSDIDISFDYHHPNVLDGLALENFAFLSRYSDAYLGIEQKYEVGGGLNLNFYSSKLTDKGNAARDKLNKKPKQASTEDATILERFQEISPKKLKETEVTTIDKARDRFGKSIKKKYSRFRAALLFAVFYELEKVNAADSLYFATGTTYAKNSFDATNFLRWGLRPSLTFQPNDIFRFRLSPFFKLPAPWEWENVVEAPNLQDSRVDYFVDIRATFSAKFTESASIAFSYRYLYDNAPRRSFINDGNGNYELLAAQNGHHNYSLAFRFSF